MKTWTTFTIFTLIFVLKMHINAQTECDYTHLTPFFPGEQGPDYTTPPPGEPIYQGFVDEDKPEGYRMLYFLHGLNGKHSAWGKAATAAVEGAPGFAPRKIYPLFPEYPEVQVGLDVASTYVKTQLTLHDKLPANYHTTQGIMIGHSQGGIVARYIDHYYSKSTNYHERMYAGLVTVATPNQGAWIINAEREHNMMSRLMNLLSHEMAAGPVSNFSASDKFLIRLISKTLNVEKLAAGLLNFGSETIGSVLVNENLPPITNDYMVGASMIVDTLNNYVPKVRRNGQVSHTNIVPFYAVRDTLTFHPNPVKFEVAVKIEEDKKDKKEKAVYEERTFDNLPLPISMATLNYIVEDVNELPFASSLEHEWGLAAKYHSTRTQYTSWVEYNRVIENKQRVNRNRCFLAGLNPVGFGCFMHYEQARKRAEKRKTEWQRGVDFLDNFDRTYRVIIGALYADKTAKDIVTCHCTSSNDLTGETIDLGTRYTTEEDDCTSFYAEQFPVDGPFVLSCTTHRYPLAAYQWRHKDSDGVVLAESAKLIPQGTFSEELILKKNDSTHMSIRNDKNTREILMNIFKGDVGEFFETETK